MTVQRPWMQTSAGEPCGRCVTTLAGGVGGLGSYEHVHQVTKVPRRRIANRQWARATGWAVECARLSTWMFFTQLEAAVVFARVA